MQRRLVQGQPRGAGSDSGEGSGGGGQTEEAVCQVIDGVELKKQEETRQREVETTCEQCTDNKTDELVNVVLREYVRTARRIISVDKKV